MALTSKLLQYASERTNIAIILPSDTYKAAGFMEATAKMGLGALIITNNPTGGDPHPISRMAADKLIAVDLTDTENAAIEVVDFINNSPVKDSLKAIIAADEQGVMLASLIGFTLGQPALRTNPPSAVALSKNKLAMRKALRDANVTQPDWRRAYTHDDIIKAANEIGFPVVIKPIGLSGSKGVIRADNNEEAANACVRIYKMLNTKSSSTEPLLVEKFISGTEVALEGILNNGQLTVLAIFDKPDPLNGPWFEETLYVTPSRLETQVIDCVVEVTKKAVSAFGLTDGPLHAELRVDADGSTGPRPTCYFIEAATRSIGGLCSKCLAFVQDKNSSDQLSLEEVIIRQALGLSIDKLTLKWHASGVLMIPIPKAGIFKGVENKLGALKTDNIVGIDISVPPGHLLQPLPEGDRYLGFIFAKAETPTQVENSLRSALAKLEVRIET